MGNLKSVCVMALMGLVVIVGSAEAMVPVRVPEPATGLLLLVALGGGRLLAKRLKS